MANVPISAFTVPANTVGIGATGYSLTGSASASFMDLAGTWNTSGTPTAINLNITDTASNANSLLMDLQVGAARRFRVFKSGSIGLGAGGSTDSVSIVAGVGRSILLGGTSQGVSIMGGDEGNNRIGLGTATAIRGELNLASNRIGWSASDPWSADTFLGRRGAANLRLGAADAAAPVPQLLSVQSVVAGTTNTAGTNLTITGSQGTGTGAGGSIVFQVAPAGSSGTAQNALVAALTINSASQVVFSSGSASAPSITFDTASTGIYGGSNAINFTRGGSRVASIDPNSFVFFSAGANISMADAGGSADVRLFRDAANTLALRNGTAAQLFNVYNTFTDASNNEAGYIGWSSNIFYVTPTKIGTGSNRAMVIGGSAASTITFATGGNRWQIDGSGNFIAVTDNAFDIGASGANRPRTGYFGTSIIAPTIQVGSSANQTITSPSANTLDLRAAGATYFQLTAGKWNFLNWNSGNGSTITSSGPFGGVTNRSADPLILICEGGSGSASPGSIQFRAAPSTTSGTDAHVDEEAMRIRVSSAGVSILSFSGVTSSFPALKRSSTTLQARLADDSDFAPVQGKLTTETAYTAGAPTATGYIVLYDSTGTAYRVPAVLN